MRREPIARLAALCTFAMRGGLALVRKALRQDAGDVLRSVAVIPVVAGRFAGQQDVPGVMVVVVPLRTILAGRRVDFGRQEVRGIVVVLEHEMDMPAGVTALNARPPC